MGAIANIGTGRKPNSKNPNAPSRTRRGSPPQASANMRHRAGVDAPSEIDGWYGICTPENPADPYAPNYLMPAPLRASRAFMEGRNYLPHCGSRNLEVETRVPLAASPLEFGRMSIAPLMMASAGDRDSPCVLRCSWRAKIAPQESKRWPSSRISPSAPTISAKLVNSTTGADAAGGVKRLMDFGENGQSGA